NWETGSVPDLFYQFTITADPGFQIFVTSITYTVAAQQNTSTYALRPSTQTGFVGVHTLNQLHPGFLLDQNTFTDIFSTGNQTTPVTFRLYCYNSDGSEEGLVNNDGEFGGDIGQDLQINGTVSVVPEPHEYGVVAGISMLVFSLYRRY